MLKTLLLLLPLVSSAGLADTGGAHLPFLICRAVSDKSFAEIKLHATVAHSRERHDTFRTWYTVAIVDNGKPFSAEMYGHFHKDLTGGAVTESEKESLSVEKEKGALVGHITYGNHKHVKMICGAM